MAGERQLPALNGLPDGLNCSGSSNSMQVPLNCGFRPIPAVGDRPAIGILPVAVCRCLKCLTSKYVLAVAVAYFRLSRSKNLMALPFTASTPIRQSCQVPNDTGGGTLLVGGAQFRAPTQPNALRYFGAAPWRGEGTISARHRGPNEQVRTRPSAPISQGQRQRLGRCGLAQPRVQQGEQVERSAADCVANVAASFTCAAYSAVLSSVRDGRGQNRDVDLAQADDQLSLLLFWKLKATTRVSGKFFCSQLECRGNKSFLQFLARDHELLQSYDSFVK